MKGRWTNFLPGNLVSRRGTHRLARARYDRQVVTVNAAPPFRTPLTLESWSVVPADDTEGVTRSLRTPVGRRGRLHIVLPWNAYQIFLLERPEVPPAEIRGALRWKIRDLIDYHPDDATIDAFEVPVETRPGNPPMIYVVAASTPRLRQLIAEVDDSPTPLAVLDIPELCLRNLVADHPSPSGIIAVYCEAEQGCLLLCRGPTLFLTRRLDFGQALRDQGEENFADRITLEIQRSLDYVDRHYRLPLPKTVVLFPMSGGSDELARRISGPLGVECTTLALRPLLDPRVPLPAEEELPALSLALGAALRQEQTP